MNCQFAPFPVLQTKRLRLRQMTLNDSNAIFAYQSDKENFPYVKMTIYKDVSQACNYIQKANAGVAENRWVFWSICLKDSGVMIGRIAIWNLNHETDSTEVGYSLFPAYRGNGYMAEALGAVRSYAFGEMGLTALEAHTHIQNLPSIRMLENSGFTYINTITNQVSADDMPVKMNFYMLKRHE